MAAFRLVEPVSIFRYDLDMFGPGYFMKEEP